MTEHGTIDEMDRLRGLLVQRASRVKVRSDLGAVIRAARSDNDTGGANGRSRRGALAAVAAVVLVSAFGAAVLAERAAQSGPTEVRAEDTTAPARATSDPATTVTSQPEATGPTEAATVTGIEPLLCDGLGGEKFQTAMGSCYAAVVQGSFMAVEAGLAVETEPWAALQAMLSACTILGGDDVETTSDQATYDFYIALSDSTGVCPGRSANIVLSVPGSSSR